MTKEQMMRIENVEEYTSVELKDIAENDYGITFFPDAKNPSKPNKQEIADAINAIDAKAADDFAADSQAQKATEPATKKKKTRAELKKEQMALHRVEVTELRKTEKYSEDDSNRVVFITWGNDVTDFHTNKVVFGVPWFLPMGCIKNLQSVTYSKVDNKRTKIAQQGTPKPAYKVEFLGNPTQAELDRIAKRQALREAQGA